MEKGEIMKQETLKKIITLADGFAYDDRLKAFYLNGDTWVWFKEIQKWEDYPLLLRRAVEGWNDKYADSETDTAIQVECDNIIEMSAGFFVKYSSYLKTDYLTPQEQAIEACLIELLEK